MQRVKIAEDLSFSNIIHGMWRLKEWDLHGDKLLTFTKQLMDLGITTFDHADIYGNYECEAVFGTALKLEPSIREKIEIVSKTGICLLSDKHSDIYVKHYNTTTDYIISQVDKSLKNLDTEYLDTLLIHRPDPFMNPEDVAEAFRQLKAAGKVRHFGVSNFKPHQFSMLQSYFDEKLVTNQIEVSPFELSSLYDGTMSQMLEQRIHPMVWSPLAGGRIFTDQSERGTNLRATLDKVREEVGANSIDEVVYAFLLQHPVGMMPIVGSGKLERVQSAVAGLNLVLSRQNVYEILQASVGKEVD